MKLNIMNSLSSPNSSNKSLQEKWSLAARTSSEEVLTIKYYGKTLVSDLIESPNLIWHLESQFISP